MIELAQMSQLPGPSILPKAERTMSKMKTYNRKREVIDKSQMTEEEYNKMNETSKHLKQKSKDVVPSPYFLMNTRLKKVRQSKHMYQGNVKMRSKFLEHYFFVNRNEIEVSRFGP